MTGSTPPGTGARAYHGHQGTRGQELHQAGEEGAGLVLGVVLLGGLAGHNQVLQADQLEAALLEAGDDLTDQTALDAVGLRNRTTNARVKTS